MRDFADRHVVVTGGAGALGGAVVKQLIERGATVHVPVLAARELDRFAFRDHASVTVRAGLDLTVEAVTTRYYAELPSLFASIHLAGGFRAAPIAETSLDDLLHLMNMNVVTCFLACREAVKAIRRSGGEGRIVNVTARPALVPTTGLAAYAASKAAVASLTTTLAEELSAEGIWVNAVAPSIMDTPQNRAAMPSADASRWPSVDAVARTIVHLASTENAVARGGIVPVYGRS